MKRNYLVLWESKDGSLNQVYLRWNDAIRNARSMNRTQRRVAIVKNSQVLYLGGSKK